MKLRNALFTTGLFAMAASGVFAQDASKQNANSASTGSRELDKWSVGVNAGPLLFYGDVKQYDYYPVSSYNSEWGFGYGLTLNRSFSSVFTLQGQLLNGSIAGTKRKLNQTFEADVFEYSLNAVINISNLTMGKSGKPRKLALYGLVGAGLTNFRTKLTDLKTTAFIKGYGIDAAGNETSRTTELVIPIGLGLKYRLSNKLDLGLEATMRSVNSDKVDGSVAGNAKDKYGYTSLTLTYKFGSKADQLEWVNPLDALYADNASMKAKIDGLSNDQDKDGVADIFDKDNSTPDGAKVYGDGTAVDTDGDGVADAVDSDPFTSKGAKVDNKGKEMDSDGDGVPDSKDNEKDTKQGALVDVHGRTIEASASSGDMSSTGYLPSVYFASGSAAVQGKYAENLAAVARVLKTNPALKLTVIGYTDAKGSEKQNDKLAMKRAEAVAKNLETVYGIEASRLKAESKGKSDLLGKNDTVNRRVDFKVSK